MAITLEEAKKNVQDDLQIGVIDEYGLRSLCNTGLLQRKL